MTASTSSLPSPADVVSFWREAGPARWFKKDAAFDRDFRERFLDAHEAAGRGELDAWQHNAEGSLALLVLLDQFPRNAFRGTARMFATDAQARAIADHALKKGFDAATEEAMRNFFYLPYMHSEDLADQDRAVTLCAALGKDADKFAHIHRDIIVKFGRFPHRNEVLGRQTSPAEQEFLASGGFAG
ncbi:MAG: DUF924 family protein [Burkholderiaceae bacterium]